MIRRVGDWVSARSGSDILMMSVAREKYLGLPDTAARIWELLEQPRSLEDLSARLCDEYDVPLETCRVQVGRFVAEMITLGALEADAGDLPPA